MDINKKTLSKCLELSQKVNNLGLGINTKRPACELFTILTKSCSDLGALITAVDYIPSLECRLNIAVDAMKEVSRVIYILNVAKTSGMFESDAITDCTLCAVKISKYLNEIFAEYSKPAPRPVQAAPQPAAPAAPEVKAEPEKDEAQEYVEAGFDEPFEG